MTSNVAIYNLWDDSYSYFNNDPTGFYYEGTIGLSGIIIVSPTELFMPVPFSYGDDRASTSRIQFDTTVTDSSGTYNYRYVSFTDAYHKVDGTGTLTLPSQVFPDVLRVKVSETIYDTLYVDMGSGYVPLTNSSRITNCFPFYLRRIGIRTRRFGNPH